MTSKQRAYLRGLAMTMQPLAIMGKNGLTDSFVEEVKVLLEAKELIKISVLNNCDFKAKQIAGEISVQTDSTLVQTVGNKITLFKVSKKDGIKHIELPN